ncbi:MAG TPA: MFS transporter, partial [Thermaerobacter sp.]
MTETQAQEYLRNVTRIHVYQALTNLSLWMPVWIVFLATERHLSLTQITVLTGISWTMVALGEVPTGALADAYGRRFSVGLGVVLAAAGIVLFGLLPSYLGLLSALILWSAGLALMSGADMAILYDSMQAAGRVAEYPRMAGRSFAVIQVSQALAGVAGGLLGSLRLDLPLFVTSGLMVLALLVVRRIAEPPVDRAPGTRYAATLRAAARVVVQRRALRYLVLFTALFSGVAWLLTFVLFQPYVVDHSLEVGWVGILFTLLRGAGTCGSLLGHRVARRLPARVALWTLPV